VDYLNEQYPKFSVKKLGRTTLIGHFESTLDFNAQKLALPFIYTIRLFEQFISEIFINEENNSSNKLLKLKSIRAKNLHQLFEKNLLKEEQKPLVQGSEFHQDNYLLKTEINEHFSQFSSIENHQFLVEKQRHLDLFFMTEKLKDACEIYLRHQILKVPFELEFGEEILNIIAKNTAYYDAIPTISIYHNIYKLLINKELNQYNLVLEKLATNDQFLPKSEVENIYNYLQNFCIRKINKGNTHFLTELFKVYQSQLSKELLFQNGYLPEFHYKNIVTTGLREKANDWVYHFIENYKQKLNPVTAENAYSYNLANYYYFTQQYAKVLKLLIRVEYTDIRYSLDAKTLLLHTYFELEEGEALLSLSDAFQQYLKRNRQVLEDSRKSYFNLLKFTKKVFQLKMNAPYWKKEKVKKEWSKVKEEVEKTKLMFNKSWLLQKIAEIKN
jgi:hypothetical protein